jgi:hypothetical protein
LINALNKAASGILLGSVWHPALFSSSGLSVSVYSNSDLFSTGDSPMLLAEAIAI